MITIKNIIKKLVIAIVLMSILISYVCTPSANAKLNIGENEFYYSGTTDGTAVEKKNAVKWLVEKLSQVADYILGIVTMGARMVFVGWTALFEHVLTWALETMSGINLNGEDISSTDLTALNDSSKNVTVQAIVYNRVPALNVNFFKIKVIDLFKDGDNYVSPTGQILKCKKCRKPVQECCTNMPGSADQIDLEGNYCDSSGEDGCKCNGKCSACRTFKAMKQQEDNEPMITLIKRTVAIWYNIIVLLAYAVMLLVLIALGIKLAISSLAGEKALYKSMLYDWIVGMAIIASIQMVMYFTIIVNEKAVEIVANAADEVNRVQIVHMTETDPDEIQSDGSITISDQEIELDVYEAIRTRAYDAKLTVGMSGMVMYIALVYYAFKYTFMYLRRFLNIALLTIMGPAIGVSYAVQKILHGKAMSFKNWLQEYILTLFIQVIHAILYAVFISEALIFSLKSVAGMIFALVMMHYAFKIDKLFRKIFNFGEGGIMKEMDAAGDLSQKRKDLKALRGALIGGGAAKNIVMNSPYSNAIKTAGRAVGSAAVYGIASAASAVNRLNNQAEENEDEDEDEDRAATDTDNSPVNEEGTPNGGPMGIPGDSNAAEGSNSNNPLGQRLNEKKAENQKKEDELILKAGRDELRKNLELAGEELEKDPNAENYQKFKEAQRKLARYNELNRSNKEAYSTSKVVAGKISQLFNISTYVQYGKGKNGKMVYKFKAPNATSGKKGSGFKAVSQMLVGSQYYDFATGKIVKNNDAMIDQLRLTNLLNLTKDDKKMFKENIAKPLGQGLGGMASMFIGMATLVENPLVGLGMLAAGNANRDKSFKILGVRRRDRKYTGRFRFNSFNVAATKNICDSAIKLSEQDRDRMMIENLRRNHHKLYLEMKKELEKAKAKGADIKVSGNYTDGFTYSTDDIEALKNSDSGISVGTLEKLESGGTIFVPAETLSNEYIGALAGYLDKDDFDLHEYYQNREFMDEKQKVQDDVKKATFYRTKRPTKARYVNADEGRRVGKGLHDIYEHHYKQLKNQEKQAEKDKLDLMKNASVAQANLKFRKLFDAQEAKELSELGYQKDGDRLVKTTKKSDDFSSAVKKLSRGDIANLEKTIDNIIKEVANGKELDLKSEKVLNEIIKKMNTEFYASNYIASNEEADTLFENGISGLKSTIKKRGTAYNKTIASLERDLKGYKKEDQKLIMDSFQEALELRTDIKKKYSTIGVEQVLEKMKEQYRSRGQGSDNPEDDEGSGPTPADVQKFVRSLEIIEAAKRRANMGEQSPAQKNEVKAAEDFLNSLDDNTRTSMQNAVDSIVNAPITEKEIMDVMARKIAERGSAEEMSSILGNIASLFGDGIKKVVGKMNTSLDQELSEQDIRNLIEAGKQSNSQSMLDMVNMVYMGNMEEAVSQVENSADSDDIKRKKLDALLTFERQVETLEEINDYALENSDRLKMKTAGSAGHKALKKEVQDESLEITRQQLEIAKFERIHGRFESIDFNKLSNTDKMEYRRIKALREKIASSQPKVEKKREKLRKNGPVSDIEKDLIKDNKLLNRK